MFAKISAIKYSFNEHQSEFEFNQIIAETNNINLYVFDIMIQNKKYFENIMS